MTTYRSNFEARLAALPALAGAAYEAEHFGYPVPWGRYTPDFRLLNGIFLEAKGFFSASDRVKMLAVRKANVGIDVRFVLQTPYETLSKDSMTTYAAWCEKHEFKWCAGNDLETLAAWAAEEGIYGGT